MFDNVVPVRRSRARYILTAGSITLHGVALFGLLAAGLWKIDKLTPERTEVTIAAATKPLGDPGGGNPTPRPEPQKTPKKPVKRPPRDLVQQSANQPDVDDAPAVEIDTGDDGPPGTGGGGDGTGVGEKTGAGCVSPPCDIGVAKPTIDVTPPPIPKVEIPTVLPAEVAVLRISGNDQIHAPDTVRTQMMREGRDTVRASVKLCLAADGSIERLKLLSSTGYPAYDELLLSEMRTWRYRPYQSHGTKSAVCSAVAFVYRMR
jgi:protein TonB